MSKRTNSGINFFQKYLTLWVFLCMVAGVLLGHFAPALPAAFARLEYARVSIPMAVLIWVMIYPMMLKVDFKSIRNIGENPKGLFVTWVVNWLVKPFTMFFVRCACKFHRLAGRKSRNLQVELAEKASPDAPPFCAALPQTVSGST